ncbi:chemotaxis protein CheW [Altererythrobacter sp. H2]|uniref:chemotaxis protein CheW n=1 Tax=Altererythrobacter sp. H2 TaxID=3108391 RepID=UPI000BDC3303|nr:chemotaxis protein CheW [Altererythrobacter sp. H2]OZA93163.1 MAG: hypothetical protein B7X57_05890 [Erythrobacter sp. 34-65-8]WRK95621.1 chemotaxis protein CheW [Altererythrobacter sp. H2]
MGDLLLLVTIAGRCAAIPGAAVQSVVELDQVAPVPLAQPHVAGLTALRSRALTVIDTRAAIGLCPTDWPTEGRAAVVEVDGHAYALLVDRVVDVAEALSAPAPSEASLGRNWDDVAEGLIETAAGPAVLVSIPCLVAGPDGAQARAA